MLVYGTLLVQIAADLEEAHTEIQQIKRQRARMEQTIQSLEKEVMHNKSSRRRTTDAGPIEDAKKDLEK